MTSPGLFFVHSEESFIRGIDSRKISAVGLFGRSTKDASRALLSKLSLKLHLFSSCHCPGRRFSGIASDPSPHCQI